MRGQIAATVTGRLAGNNGQHSGAQVLAVPSWISICPPSATHAIQFLIDDEVAETQAVPQLVCHSNTSWARADDDGIESLLELRHDCECTDFPQ
jgi:hypothetical protein